MSDLSLEEARDLKSETSGKILELLHDFEQKTGMDVDKIAVETTELVNGGSKVRYVKIDANL